MSTMERGVIGKRHAKGLGLGEVFVTHRGQIYLDDMSDGGSIG